DANVGDPAREDLQRDGERALAAEHDEPVDAELAQIPDRLAENLVRLGRAPVLLLLDETATVARTQNRPAAREEPADRRRRQLAHPRLAEQPFETVFDT